jgi:xanthine dehydrogenase small subunit
MLDLPKVSFDREALQKQLASIVRKESLVYEHGGHRFFAPRSLAELLELRLRIPRRRSSPATPTWVSG